MRRSLARTLHADAAMRLTRREPFRVFSPLSLLIGWVGVLSWLLCGRGAPGALPGVYFLGPMPRGQGPREA